MAAAQRCSRVSGWTPASGWVMSPSRAVQCWGRGRSEVSFACLRGLECGGDSDGCDSIVAGAGEGEDVAGLGAEPLAQKVAAQKAGGAGDKDVAGGRFSMRGLPGRN